MDAADQHDVEVALEAAFSCVFASKIALKCGTNELLELQLNTDGLDKVSTVVIERYFDCIYVFADSLRCRLPTTHLMAAALLVCDKKRYYKLSGFTLSSSRHAWCEFEMTKWHTILSRVNRYASRPGNPRATKLRLLKALWLKHRPNLNHECISAGRS